MKKKLYKNKWFILVIIIILALLVFKVSEKRKFYTSFFTGQTITIWKSYVIFEKYEGTLPPKDNYIKLHTNKKAHVNVFFKKDNTVIIWSETDDPIKTRFDKCGYDVMTYNGIENIRQYYDKCQYSDSIADAEYEFKKEYGSIKTIINEIAADTVYISIYNEGYFNVVINKRCRYPRNASMFER